jgi:hypothetical protein
MSTSIFSKLKPERSSKKLESVISKTFDVVKIKGDSEYFKEINRRF